MRSEFQDKEIRPYRFCLPLHAGKLKTKPNVGLLKAHPLFSTSMRSKQCCKSLSIRNDEDILKNFKFIDILRNLLQFQPIQPFTIQPILNLFQWRRQDFGSGEHFRGSAQQGVRGRSPPDAGEFSKIKKKFLRKLQKFTILANFPKKLTNSALIFRTFGRKTQLFGKHLRKF